MLHNEHHRNRMGEKGGKFGYCPFHTSSLISGLRFGVLSRVSSCRLRFTPMATLHRHVGRFRTCHEKL